MPLVHDLIAAKPPDTLAVTDPSGDRLTYGDLGVIAGVLATALEAYGVRPGDRLVAVCENLARLVPLILAVSQVGAWFTPVNARMSGDEIEAVVGHSGARCVVFTMGSDRASAHSTRWQTAALGHGLAVSPIRDVAPEPTQMGDNAVAALLYTTGTTSRPKGVMLTHANLCWNARISAGLRGMNATDVNLGALPGSHVFGFSSVILASLHAGAALHMLPRFSAEAALSAMAGGVSVFSGVPQMFERILTYLERTGSAPVAPRLKYLSAGGAPLDPDWKARIEATFGLPLNNGYGLTETSPSAAGTDWRNPPTDTSVGGAVPEATLTIDAPNAAGVGELLIRSPGVMKGYYRDRAATEAVLMADGTFRSGDLARIDEAGALHIVGRTKELIVRSGFNVYPPEIEAMMTRHGEVHQAAVVGRRVRMDEEIIAFFTGPADAEALRAWLSTRLVAYKVPKHIIAVEAFPTAATGKILKHTLLTHFAAQLPRVAA